MQFQQDAQQGEPVVRALSELIADDQVAQLPLEAVLPSVNIAILAHNFNGPGVLPAVIGIKENGLNMFGDAVRDLLDPRLRGGGGRLDADAARSV